MDLEKMARQALAGQDTAALESLAKSETGARLAKRLEGLSLEKAVRDGDMSALTAAVRTILSTSEGREFAEKVKKAADGHGR